MNPSDPPLVPIDVAIAIVRQPDLKTCRLTMLKAFGVDKVQGYHLDMPRANHPALDL